MSLTICTYVIVSLKNVIKTICTYVIVSLKTIIKTICTYVIVSKKPLLKQYVLMSLGLKNYVPLSFQHVNNH